MSATAPGLIELASDCAREGLTVANCARIAAELARMFQVRPDEVGILRLEKDSLVFVHPAKLHNVGRIPLNSQAVAVRTAHSRRPEIINTFSSTRHATFFEMVDLGGKPGEKKASKEELVIQKLMSVPVVDTNQVLGVIQICRKGATPQIAGANFTPGELQNLFAAAGALAKCFGK